MEQFLTHPDGAPYVQAGAVIGGVIIVTIIGIATLCMRRRPSFCMTKAQRSALDRYIDCDIGLAKVVGWTWSGFPIVHGDRAGASREMVVRDPAKVRALLERVR